MVDLSKYGTTAAPVTKPTTAAPASTGKSLDLSKYGVTSSPVTDPAASKDTQQSFASRVWSDLQTRGEAVRKEITNPQQDPFTSGLKATAQAFGGIGDIGGELIKSLPGGKVVTDYLGKVVGNITDPNNKGILQDFGRFLQAHEADHPEAVKAIATILDRSSAGGDISLNILGSEVGKMPLSSAEKVTQKAFADLTQTTEESISKAVLKNYEKGVKPSLAGKQTLGKLADYKENVVNAVKTINDNKANLNLTDEFGEVLPGKTPESLNQLAEAIDQTKKTIFGQYDALAKQAGEAGVTVDASGLAGDLDTVISSKSLAITNPEAISYAEKLKERLVAAGKLDANMAQEVIQNYNKSLEAFYKNPSYDNASKAAIDALIANRMRVALDKGIEGATGKEYQALKNQYGSLKSIEQDVVKASIRDARRNVKGLLDFTDILSGGQLVSGILNLNPAQLAVGAGQKAITEYYKYLNSPNRAIRAMFDAASKTPTP